MSAFGYFVSMANTSDRSSSKLFRRCLFVRIGTNKWSKDHNSDAAEDGTHEHFVSGLWKAQQSLVLVYGLQSLRNQGFSLDSEVGKRVRVVIGDEEAPFQSLQMHLDN